MLQNLERFSNSIDTAAVKARLLGYQTAFTVGTLTNFTSTLVSGGPVVQGFLSAIENLTGSVLKYSAKAFSDAAEKEVSAIAGAGSIANVTKNKLNFGESQNLFAELQTKLAQDAAVLPGSTADYTGVFTQLVDDFGAALIKGGDSAAQMTDKLKTIPESVKAIVLQSKLYGQNIPIASVTKSYASLLATGQVKNNEIFFKRNPVLKAAIADFEQKNGKKLTKYTTEERALILPKIFASTISKDQEAALTTSFESKMEGFKSAVFDPLTGLLGFNRKIKSSDGKNDTTLFQQLSNVIKPILEVFTSLATAVMGTADPLKALGDLIEANIAPLVRNFVSDMTRFIFAFKLFEAEGGEGLFGKINAGLKAGFNFDLTKFDLSNEVDKFFAKIFGFINGVGEGVKTNSEFDQTVSSILKGLTSVFFAIFEKVKNYTIANPQEAFTLAAVFNPGLLLQGLTLVGVAFSVLLPVLSTFATAVGAIVTGIATGAIWIPLAIGTAIAALGVGLLVVVDYFSVPLTRFGNWLGSIADSVGGPFGFALNMAKEGLKGLVWGAKDAIEGFKKILKGDFLGGVIQLVSGLFTALGGLFKSLVGFILVPFTALGDMIALLVNKIGGFLGLDQTSQQVNKPVVDTSALDNLNPVKTNAKGNSLGLLLAGISKESNLMPTGANVVLANTSEAILPRESAKQVYSSLTSKGGLTANINIGVSTNASPEDIGFAIRRELSSLLAEV